MEPSQKPSKTLVSAKETLESQLIKIKGVEAIGIGGEPGRFQIEVCVNVLSEDLKSRIPDEFQGYPVIVKQTGEFTARRGKERK